VETLQTKFYYASHILEKYQFNKVGKIQQLTMGWADRNYRDLLRTVAEVVEKHKMPVFVGCKGLILLGTISWNKAKMDFFDSLVRRVEECSVQHHPIFSLMHVPSRPLSLQKMPSN
jgi:hypothetical protein